MDADSCPVKEEIVEIANSFTMDAVFVASYAHMKNDLNGAVWKFVDSSKEAADLFIMNYVKSGDVVVTQDIGLASTLLLNGVYVLSPRGILFEENEIRTALEMRHLSVKARRRGVYGKGPKPYSREDRSRFVQKLTKILSNLEGIQ
ncbi:YaiI/YqxD family protein [Bacillus sp. NTK034]|uniref:YaiI/YqxD family protein n=1 Tax=Bacillus sp. NTK034 TaxID=2802176 RepID=UPI001A8EE95F|nr:DUF188 domain-containing protein [Bacillus sp. NTK034]MBN8200577.1 DUF188 domain-containing protein [Bacillus sp. NTK034]